MNRTSNRIVAAIAGEDSGPVLQFASKEAIRSGSDLHLVHVVKLPPLLRKGDEVAENSARVHAALVLDRASRTAADLVARRASISQELIEQSHGVVNDIVARSVGARMVVLQHRRIAGIRLTHGSTTHGVAARAHAPVVSVPHDWRPAGPAHRRVTFGVQSASRSDDTLRVAFELAAERGDGLRVVHAWWLANGYDTPAVGDDVRADWDRRFRAALAPHLEELRALDPTVDVDVQVRHAPTDVALEEAAADSDVLVIGRRHSRLPTGSHLGPVTRFALQSSTVPVVVVDTARSQRRAKSRVEAIPIIY